MSQVSRELIKRSEKIFLQGPFNTINAFIKKETPYYLNVQID